MVQYLQVETAIRCTSEYASACASAVFYLEKTNVFLQARLFWRKRTTVTDFYLGPLVFSPVTRVKVGHFYLIFTSHSSHNEARPKNRSTDRSCPLPTTMARKKHAPLTPWEIAKPLLEKDYIDRKIQDWMMPAQVKQMRDEYTSVCSRRKRGQGC